MFNVTGKIDKITRLNNSVNGNPRYEVEINGYMLTTKSDAHYSYNIENLYIRQCEVIAICYDTKKSTRIQTIKKVD